MKYPTVFILGALALAHHVAFAQRVVFVRTGSDFVEALAAQDVTVLRLAPLIFIEDVDFAGVRPLVLQRNVTIEPDLSVPSSVLCTNLKTGAVRMAKGVFMTFRRLTMAQTRRVLGTLSPGFDVILPSLANDTGSAVQMINCLLVHSVCLPRELQVQSIVNSSRPAAFGPGPNRVGPLLPLPANCSNSSTAPLLQRCWPRYGLYEDLVLLAMDANERGQLFPTNYAMRVLDSRFICRSVMAQECVQTLGTVGCFLFMTSSKLDQGQDDTCASLLEADSAAAAPGRARNGGLAGTARVLAIALPCALGGAGLLLVGWLLWVRRRRQGGTAPPSMAPGGSSSIDAGVRLVMSGPYGHADAEGGSGRGRCGPGSGFSGGGGGGGKGSRGGGSSEGGKGRADRADMGPESLTGQHSSPSTELPSELVSPDTVRAAGQSDDQKHVALATASILLDTPVLVTPTTPHRADVRLDLQCDTEVQLLPAVRGQGSFGRVVEGLYAGQRVAVKLVPDVSQIGGSPESALATFTQEVEVLGRCDHPNVVRLLAACVRPPRLCLVMELMDTSLDRLLHGGPRAGGGPGGAVNGNGGDRGYGPGPGTGPGELLPLDKVIYIGIEVARALEYLHPTIVHRDLKPGNVLLQDASGPRPTVKLSDFGLSRLRSTVLVTRHPEAGTPAYMAPELYDINNHTVTDKSDIFSLGVLLWEMLSGLVPWAGCDALVVAYAITINKDRLSLSAIPPGRAPPKLLGLIKRLWDHDPLRRPAAAEVVKQLLLIQQQLARPVWPAAGAGPPSEGAGPSAAPTSAGAGAAAGPQQGRPGGPQLLTDSGSGAPTSAAGSAGSGAPAGTGSVVQEPAGA
ncbi:hypothetical protein GPECTOR_97g748 [Gonium pectorale]|uniref:Protein kinase domain-containing protein n=1 Tax=Gonium pectorale TaxID=33097 RepID=A0A150G1P2_GONPE|nr:hypothetical protein GPECTOR_97g748 [Gonium pectorale]|eukprot:KXZ43210.1 hypothetical protein GPECTOR_97g748 [Gonium pectorale]